jgi:membrane protease YdiL (CAAX protease family)
MEEPPARSPVASAILAYGLGFALSFCATAALVVVVGTIHAAGDASRIQRETVAFVYSAPGLMAGALVHSVVLTAILLAFALADASPLRSARETLRLGRSGASPLAFLAAATGLVGVNLACGALREALGVSTGEVMGAIARAFESPTPLRLGCALVTIGVVPALAEEAFFRGLIQGRLRQAWSRWPAILATAAAFGLIHGDRVQGPVAFVTGVWLGWVVERFGSIRPAVVAHASNNALFLVVAALGQGRESPGMRAWVLAGAMAAFTVSVVVVRREDRIHYAPPARAR